MSKKYKLITAGAISLVAALLIKHYFRNANFAVLNPTGSIALSERRIMFQALALSLVVVLPVFALTLFITIKYRETNHQAKYLPEWDHNRLIETIWWGIPTILIIILSTITWNSSHQLDPFKPINSSTKTMTIQVVALQWKWLFIYPEQHIASVNFVQIPINTPIDFEITADAPMNSFWIPQLGGQIYAMPGMSTNLNLIANQVGDYRGSSANLSGKGFASMVFVAKVSLLSDFDAWVKSAQSSKAVMDQIEYDKLAMPSSNNPPVRYAVTDSRLYDKTVMKYMTPASQMTANPLDQLMNGAGY